MKVRIFNDGKPGYMTQVTDVETGKPLEYVTDIKLYINAKELAHALVTVHSPIVDVIADAQIENACPCCGKAQEA